jgi:hypothetical protein
VGSESQDHSYEEREARTFTGGVRWGWKGATWPFAKLTIEPNGLALRPPSARLSSVWRFFGVPTLQHEWSSIDAVELVRTPFESEARGFSFMVEGKRLVFWTYAIEAVLDELARYAPDKVVDDVEPRRLFF